MLARCLIVSSILLFGTAIFLPASQDCFTIFPVAGVVLYGHLNCVCHPLSGKSRFCIVQSIRDQRRERSDILFIQPEDIRPFQRSGHDIACLGPSLFREELRCCAPPRMS